jgi:hypothetical protein
MTVNSKFVGVIRIDSSASAAFILEGFRSPKPARRRWRSEFAENADFAPVVADVRRLRRELRREYRRLQARLAA